MKKWSEEAWDVARPTYLKNHRTSVRRRACPGYVGRRQVPVLPAAGFAVSGALLQGIDPHRFPSYREGAHRGFHPLRFGRHRGRGGAARLLSERRRTGSRRDQPDMPALHLGTASPGHSPGRSGSRCRASLLLGLSAGRAADHRPAAGKWGIPMHSGSRPTPIPPSPKRLRRLSESATHWPKKTGPETRRRMTDIFLRCTKMEWLFWDSAWYLESWKI